MKLKNKKKKVGYFPDGGPINSVTIPSGVAYGTTNQVQGVNSSMADILKDPYAFSFNNGITTLSRNQWNKLLPEQQQTIWRQGLSKMGFNQSGNNSFQNFGEGGDIKESKADVSKHKNYYVNNLIYLSPEEKQALIKASETTGVSPEIIWTNMMAEGMDKYFVNRLSGDSREIDHPTTGNSKNQSYLDGFNYFGFDTLGDSISSNKYIPKNVQYTTEKKLADDYVNSIRNNKDLSLSKEQLAALDSKYYMQTNENLEFVNAVHPKTLSDAMYIMAGELRNRRDSLDKYATDNNIKLSSNARDFFNYVAYNSGEGNMQKMLKAYNDKGYLKDDTFLKSRPDKYWEDSYNYAQKRINNQIDVQNQFYFKPAPQPNAKPLVPLTEEKINQVSTKEAFKGLYGNGGPIIVPGTSYIPREGANRPGFKNPDGSFTNEHTINISDDRGSFIIPTVWADKDGVAKQYTEEEAIKRFRKTGEHMGAFSNDNDANRGAQFREFMNNELSMKNGGKIKKFGPGGNTTSATPTKTTDPTPIYVTDPNDPRYKAYQDSLVLHTQSILAKDIFLNKIEPLLKQGKKDEALKAWNGDNADSFFSETRQKVSVPYYNLAKLNGKNPSPEKDIPSKYDPTFGVYEYKKPLQPVRLGRPKMTETPINTNTKTSVDIKPMAKRTTPQMLRFAYPAANNADNKVDTYSYNPQTKQYEFSDAISVDEAKERGFIMRKDLKSVQSAISQINPRQHFDLGGSIGSAAGVALNFVVPGLGAVASPLLGALGSAIDKSDTKQELPQPVIETAVTKNPYGNYKMGGKLNCKYGGKTSAPSIYLKAMSGGKLDNIAGDIYLAKGKSHLKGGISGDTNADGVQDIEFEGNELYVDNEKYIINKDIAKPYTKMFKKLTDRNDNVSKKSIELAKKDMIQKNEANLAAKYGQRTFASGGSFGSPQDFGETLIANDIVQPGSEAKTADSGLPMTPGDYWQLAGMTLAPLANIGRGIFGKAEQFKTDRYDNPYNDQVLGELNSLRYNEQPVQNLLDRTFSAGKETIDNSTNSASARRSNLQALYTNLGQKRAEANMQGQQINNGYRTAYAEAMNNLGAQKVGGMSKVDEINTTNKAAKENLITTGLTQLGQGAATYGQFKNQNTSNNLQLALLNELTTNYGFDVDSVTKLMKAGYTREDIIKFLSK